LRSPKSDPPHHAVGNVVTTLLALSQFFLGAAQSSAYSDMDLMGNDPKELFLNQNDLASLVLTAIVLAGGLAMRPRIEGDASRLVGWWLGFLHALFAVLAVRAAVLADGFVFRAAMIIFTGYAVGMAVSEVQVLLRPKEST